MRNVSGALFSGAPLRGRPGRGLWLSVLMGLAGCAGAQLPEQSPAQSSVQSSAGSGDMAEGRMVASLGLPGPMHVPRDLKPASLVPNVVARQALVDAREAMQNKRWDTLIGLVPLAQADPVLGSYARYWLLRQQLQDTTQPVPAEALQRFMQDNHDAYLADRLRADWIVAAARASDFDTVNRLGPVRVGNAQVDCARLQAAQAAGQPVSAEKAMELFQPVRSCWAMMDQFVSAGIVGWNQVQPLLRATLETSKTGDAQRLAGYIFNSSEMTAYRALMKSPKKWLAAQKPPKTRTQTELATLALSRLARGDREAGAAEVRRWKDAIPAADLQWVWGQFGLVAALNVENSAMRWYRLSGDAPMTDYNHAWQVRAELRQATIDWAWVARAIHKMSPRQRAEPVWVYWLGRSLAARGDQAAAHKLYVSIENELNFYGQLANEELGRPLSIPPAPTAVTSAELQQARANPGLRRAIALFDLGWRPEAVPEWNFALRGMSDRQLRAAAELARQEEIFDRVVNTSLQTRDEIDFSQRFIAPFEGRVSEKARQINLDPAWVYGLIRQESRFITNARSRVGASGLMQLMPATAKWVAGKIGMKDFTPSSVNDFDTNTILGTNYLNMVLQRLDGSQVLATAGYNAGPGRSIQWRAKLDGPVEGAVFAETIPFTETRLYVKHVMSNAIYYAMLFSGKPHSLKALLGVVAPQPRSDAGLP